MRPEENPLDLNNLPEDYDKHHHQHSQDNTSSSAGSNRKKKSGAANKDLDESEAEAEAAAGKVYQCRFCSLNFCKSQALGGHMNRHRQERETETLNKARQLVFTNDLAPSAHMAAYVSGPIPNGGGYHQATTMTDPPGLRSMYPTTRMFPSSSPLVVPPPPPQSMYASPPRLLSFHSQYPPPAPPVNNDYFVGHVLSNPSYGPTTPTEGNYTCIGAPVGHGFGSSGGGGGGGGGGGRDVSALHNQEEGLLNWGRR